MAAAGVWSVALLATIGVDLPIETEFHQVAVLSHGPGRGTPIACIDSTTQTYFRPEAAGTRNLVGSFRGPRGIDPIPRPPAPGPRRPPALTGARSLGRLWGKTHPGNDPGWEGWRGSRGWRGRRAAGGACAGRRGPGDGDSLACTT